MKNPDEDFFYSIHNVYDDIIWFISASIVLVGYNSRVEKNYEKLSSKR